MAAKTPVVDFPSLGQAIAQLGDAIQSRMAQREALAQERDRVAALPLARTDLIAAIDAWIDSVRPHYLKHLQEVLAPRSRRADRPLPESRHGDFGLIGDASRVNSFPVLALLADPIKASLATMVRELDFDDGEALPAGERQELLAALDAKIEQLDSELADLHQQAAAAGLAPIRRQPTREEIQRLFANGAPNKPEDIALAATNLERSLNGEPPLKRPCPPPRREMILDKDLPDGF